MKHVYFKIKKFLLILLSLLLSAGNAFANEERLIVGQQVLSQAHFGLNQELNTGNEAFHDRLGSSILLDVWRAFPKDSFAIGLRTIGSGLIGSRYEMARVSSGLAVKYNIFGEHHRMIGFMGYSSQSQSLDSVQILAKRGISFGVGAEHTKEIIPKKLWVGIGSFFQWHYWTSFKQGINSDPASFGPKSPIQTQSRMIEFSILTTL